MACSKCDGYYTCWCEVDRLEDEVKSKLHEVDSLRMKIRIKIKEKNKIEHEIYRRKVPEEKVAQ